MGEITGSDPSSTSSTYNDKLTDSTGLEITGKILVAVLMTLFFTVVLVLLLHLYFKGFTYRTQYDIESAPNTPRRRNRRRSRRFEFITGHTATSHHLDPSVLNSIPVVAYSSKEMKEMECAVCLSETVDGEKIRMLPNCNHGFHVDCIDMWFQSNSTCPICRNPVSSNSEGAELKKEAVPQSSSAVLFPTNVLVWGNNQGEVARSSEEPTSSSTSSSNSNGNSNNNNRQRDEMVIEIPTRQMGGDEELRSPMMKRLKSLKRLLSMGGASRVNPSTSTADYGGKDPEH